MITRLCRPVVLKLSGESLGADGDRFDREMFGAIADQIGSIHRAGIGVAVVVGGGNIFRGARDAEEWNIPSDRGDRIGMYATGLNGMFLGAACESRGLSVVEITRGPCRGFGNADWTPVQIKAAINRGAVPIISGGLGEPGISTDGPAVQLGIDLDAGVVIMAKSHVSGVYSADPRLVPTARPIDRISAGAAIDMGLAVVDTFALELCRDSRTAIHVVGADEPVNLFRASVGEAIGSMIVPGVVEEQRDDPVAV